MTPAETLEQRLSSLAPHVAPGPQTIVESAGTSEVRFTVDRLDPTGATHRAIEVAHGEPTPEPLAERARRVAQTRGLSENLKVLEVDPGRGQAVLRSDAPESRPDGVRYFEVVVGDDRSTVHRYHARPHGTRQPVPFPLTHETAARLAGALSARPE